MSMQSLAGSHDWQEFWDSAEVRRRLEKEGMHLLSGIDDERARGALQMAHFLQTLPSYEAQRESDHPVERVSLKSWLLDILNRVTDGVFPKGDDATRTTITVKE